MRPFVELCAKSNFSFLRGASHPEEIIQTAHDLGYRGIALTDINGFYGMVRGHEKARQLLFTFLVGTEISIENSSLILIAKSFEGYKRLCRLMTEGFKRGVKGQPHFDRSLLESTLDQQFIHSLLPPRDFPSPELFGFLRQRTQITQLMTHHFHPDRDRPLARWLQTLPAEIPRAWTWDARFHQRSRAELFEIEDAILNNTNLYQKLPSPNGELYLKPLSELDRLKVPTAWTDETLRLAEACAFSPTEIRYHYPQEWLPAGKTAFEFLKELCEIGFHKRYAGDPALDVRKQLVHELELVQELKFEDYFLTVWDIVQFARSKNILCQGRGSAANSVICYLLEITAIDPVRMNLLFERFISRERNEAPDIDVDFEHERREEVIQYIYNKYGRHRAAMTATLITYRSKSSFREVGKALDIPPQTIDLVSKRLSWRESSEEIFSNLEWAKENPAKATRWMRLAKTLKGFPRHLGQHTGGMIISHDRLDELSPLEPASMENRTVIQWDKYDIEKLGLLKIDILGLGMLTCIRKTFEVLKQSLGVSLELHTIPANDKKTFEMIGRARTVGVFQIESRAQMSMLPRLKPQNFYDLVVEVAIVRPGPIQGGMVHPYLRRRMGLEKVSYAHPLLKPILEKTLGVPIFQEQVMKMAIEVAGYSPGEADELRRAMGAWKKSGNLESYAADMAKRMIARGVPEKFAQQVCQQILGFGEYGFPESHAASFALLTYASAYLKAHYPFAFLCGLLNSMPLGFYSLHVLTSSFAREGVRLLPVHTQYSDWDHKLELDQKHQWALRLGFRIVKGLSKAHVDEFIRLRETGTINLYVFDSDERGALALATEEIDRRLAYWKALDPEPSDLALVSRDKPIRFPELSPMSSMFLDFEFTETTLKEHPASLIKRKRWRYAYPIERLVLAENLERTRSSNVTCFGIVQIVQSPPTAKGIFFITLEDETGFLNLVLKPDIFKKYKELIRSEWGLLVTGRLQNQNGALSILVSQVHSPRIAAETAVKLTSKTNWMTQTHGTSLSKAWG